MSRQEVRIPDIGDFEDVPVIEVLVSDGDRVEVDTPLVTLESDKATMEVPSPAAGVVRDLKLKVGDKVKQGDLVCSLESEAAPAEPAEPAEPPAEDRPAASPPQEKKPAPAQAEAPGPAPAGGGGSLSVKVPDIGDFKDVPVIELLVAEGDTVDKDQSLITLESDKAKMDVPAPQRGVVRSLKVKEGDKLSEGDEICVLETAGEGAETPGDAAEPAAAAAQASPPPAAETPAEQERPQREPAPAGDFKPEAQAGLLPHASPAVRKYARELGVDLSAVAGSGHQGRILYEDVQGFVKKAVQAPPPAHAVSGGAGIPALPAQDFSQYGGIEEKPLARIRRLSAAQLHRSWLNVPHVTQTDEADITELESFRKSAGQELIQAGGPKLTLLPFIIKACAAAMQAYPEFNSSLSADGERLIFKKYCHIGFAADTPNGLLVPVVRDAARKGIAQLAAECGELAAKARDGKLKPDEMKGGCFSISSLGGIGGSHFTPIVNAPEVGILGVSRSVMKPVWDGKAFQPRLMLPLSLSYDHRVIDGAYAARFIVYLVKLLGDLRRLTL